MNNNYASFKIRLLASLLDGVIFLLLGIGLFYYISLQPTLPQAVYAIFLSLIILFNPLLLFYSVLFTYYFGGSLGKLLTGLRVVSADDKRLSFKRILFRQFIGYSFSWIFFGLGYLSIIKDPQKQAWHDKSVGTVVKAKGNMLIVGVMLYILLLFVSISLFVNTVKSLSSGPLLKEIEKLTNKKTHFSKVDKSKITSPKSWKTYTNSFYGYSIRYPENWSISQLNNDGLNLRFEGPKTGKPTLDNFAQINISVQKNTVPLPELVKKDFKRMRENEGQPVNYDEIKMINIKGGAQGYSFSCPFLVHQDCIYIPLKSGYINILTSYSDDENKGYGKTINEILSTFTFTELVNSRKLGCAQYGGEWLEEYNECESTTLDNYKNVCQENGGTFYQCLSPCRHNPKTQNCIEVCMEVCKY